MGSRSFNRWALKNREYLQEKCGMPLELIESEEDWGYFLNHGDNNCPWYFGRYYDINHISKLEAFYLCLFLESEDQFSSALDELQYTLNRGSAAESRNKLFAGQGDIDAQNKLGAMYYEGAGVPQDYKAAFRCFKLAADKGNAEAQINLGRMCHFGQGISRDEKIAFEWYRLAAEQGLTDAQYNLGLMYKLGRGVAQDHKEASNWYRLAAKQGVIETQNTLDGMYDYGESVSRDDKAVVKWYKLAAEQGDVESQYVLGMMYANGEGVTQDFTLAYMWWDIAATQGNEDAKRKSGIIEEQMTSADVSKAQELARKCVAKDYKNC
jgi:hypothetical protein